MEDARRGRSPSAVTWKSGPLGPRSSLHHWGFSPALSRSKYENDLDSISMKTCLQLNAPGMSAWPVRSLNLVSARVLLHLT
jgi:hypothetical protein